MEDKKPLITYNRLKDAWTGAPVGSHEKREKVVIRKLLIGLGISVLSKNNLGNSLMESTILSDRKKFNIDFKGD